MAHPDAAVLGQRDDVQRRMQRGQGRHLAGERPGQAGVGVQLDRALVAFQPAALQDFRQARGKFHDARVEPLHGRGDVGQLLAVVQQPAGRLLEQRLRGAQHGMLDGCAHLVIQRLDGLPHAADLEDFAGDGEGAGDRGDVRAGLVLHPEGEHRAHAVHEAVGDHGGDDLARQRVLAQVARVALAQRRGEVAPQFPGEVLVLGHAGGDHLGIQRHLRVTHHHREFRAREALAGLAAQVDLLVVGQILERAVEPHAFLQQPDEPAMFIDACRRGGLGDPQRLCLQVIVPEHQRGHFAGHADQQFLPPCRREGAVAVGDADQDLDVDLVVRAVDPRRVVDEIGVHAAAVERVLDAAALGEAQVAALADHPAA